MTPLCIGKIIKPYGLKGYLKVIFYIDDESELDLFSAFFIKDNKDPSGFRRVDFVSIAGGGSFFKVKFEGCNDRTTADSFRGVEIFVDESELPELKQNVFYQKDLIGLDVLYNNEPFGRVVNIIDVAKSSVLIVKMKNGREMAIPFSGEYVTEVDIKGKRLFAIRLDYLM